MITFAWGALATAAPTTYVLVPAESHLYAVVRNDRSTIGGRLGHDHAIVATTFAGTVTWDPADLSACDVTISFPVTALAADPSGYRVRAGLDGEGGVGAKDKDQIKRNLLKPSQLDGERFPTVRYASTSCTASSRPDRFEVTGRLEIRGIGHGVTVPMAIDVRDGALAATGRFEITHSDFGFKPFTNLLGALRNLDALEVVVDVKGR